MIVHQVGADEPATGTLFKDLATSNCQYYFIPQQRFSAISRFSLIRQTLPVFNYNGSISTSLFTISYQVVANYSPSLERCGFVKSSGTSPTFSVLQTES